MNGERDPGSLFDSALRGGGLRVPSELLDPRRIVDSGREHLPTEVLEGPRSRGTNSEWAAYDLDRAELRRAPIGLIRRLETDLERARRVDAGTETDPQAYRLEIMSARYRSALPSYQAELTRRFHAAEAARKAAPPAPPIGDPEKPPDKPPPKRSIFRQAIVVAGLLAPAWLTFLLARSDR
jgi:hypothetical protein